MSATTRRSIRGAEPSDLQVSVVILCLNEANTIATCVAKAQRALQESGIAGEIVLADNGSTDSSQDIACLLGLGVTYSVTTTAVEYRVPFDPIFILVGTVGGDELGRRRYGGSSI